jgi:hypothetical protein
MTQILATIKGVQVFQEDDGRVHWTSGAAVDADGANGQGAAYSPIVRITLDLITMRTPDIRTAVGAMFLSTTVVANRSTTARETGTRKLPIAGVLVQFQPDTSTVQRFRTW